MRLLLPGLHDVEVLQMRLLLWRTRGSSSCRATSTSSSSVQIRWSTCLRSRFILFWWRTIQTRTIRLIRVGTLQSSGHWNDHVMHCLKLRLIQFSLFEAKTNFLGISLDVVLMA
ncbi:uncharacterized protein [Triticum aestivum]|uniref:uncharacterized protein n=1 Tax=Triticum aestivum TaxID=4565 RepID=UPI001D010B5A|nr:uncharacterized protein LOC123040102 [Triticum aestivum]XP_044321553.1 uncharacterized protein LOC123043235 [Triticum aestivum]